jgi:hypothetical protein
MKVLILGAGASYGHGHKTEPRPPLADIEHVFGQIESTWRLGVYQKEDTDELTRRFGSAFSWITPVEMLQSYMVDMLLTSTGWLASNTCPYHDFLAHNWFAAGDVVLSFNYDLITVKPSYPYSTR